MLKSEVFRNRKLVKDRRRTKRIKKQNNYRTKTLQGLSRKDLEREKNKKKEEVKK